MSKKFDFNIGDIISYAGETFEVLEVNFTNTGGTVAYWHNGVRGDVVTEYFYWSAYGEDCQLVKRAG
ncbi:hypothetical protein [Bacillus cereus]|uniref:hypothetical protein n=1 Tax=Bacillus cereus TaxID=1396 RepID=UPI001C8B9368|nr:hypothetical protein [Bacillus cereus]MBX9158637.1 hypothetical protein [Bacillus cereus]